MDRPTPGDRFRARARTAGRRRAAAQQHLPVRATHGDIPTTCPTCRCDLVRNALPGVGLYVSACPDRHGAWMARDVVETLGRFVTEHATLAAKKRDQIKRLYPNLDTETSEAIERHLCGFDVV